MGAVVEIWFESLIPFLLKDSHIVHWLEVLQSPNKDNTLPFDKSSATFWQEMRWCHFDLSSLSLFWFYGLDKTALWNGWVLCTLSNASKQRLHTQKVEVFWPQLFFNFGSIFWVYHSRLYYSNFQRWFSGIFGPLRMSYLTSLKFKLNSQVFKII